MPTPLIPLPRDSALWRRIMRFARIEITFISHHLVRNVIAGSGLMPMPIRAAIWRMSGLRIQTMNIREGCLVHNSYLVAGRRVLIGRGCVFEGSGEVTLADDCWLGPECSFVTSHHDYRRSGHRLVRGCAQSRPVSIGARVWAGARVTFLPGAVVEDDVILAAGSVVTGRCRSGWVYGGVPARQLFEIPSDDAEASVLCCPSEGRVR